MNNYDADPDALAWARAKIQRRIDHYRDFERQAKEKGTDSEIWRNIAWSMERDFIGAGGCVIAAFDERLPQYADLLVAPVDQEGQQQ